MFFFGSPTLRWGAATRGLRGGNDIHEAASRGKLGAARHLLRTVPGAVAATDGVGRTALHCGANIGHAEVCRALLAANAAVDARTATRLLAKDCAAAVPGETFLGGSRSPEVGPRCIVRRTKAKWRW